MRILHIIPSLKKGGAERLVLDICRFLKAKKGVEVNLIILQNINEFPSLSKNIKIQYIPAKVAPSISGKSQIEIDEYIKFIDRFQPDVIHSHLFEAEMVSREYLLPNVKYFTHFHNNMPQMRNFDWQTITKKHLLTSYYEKKRIVKKYRNCDNYFIGISKNTYNYIQKTLPQFKNQTYLLPNAVDTSKFKNDGKGKNPMLLVNIGSFRWEKRQDFLIEVVNELHQRGLPVSLNLIGDGSRRSIIEEAINQYNLGEYIHLLGAIENPEYYLKEASIFVHGTVSEAFGLVLVEAMAAGLPVVTTDGGGNKDVMEEGKNGFLILDDNISSFADKVELLIKNENLYQTLSEYAIDYSQQFDIHNYINQLLVLYHTTGHSRW